MQYIRLNIPMVNQYKGCPAGGAAANGGGKTVGRWLKDRREKKKEEARTHNAQLHAAISVAGVASVIAAIAAATAASSGAGKDELMAKTDMAVASAATLVAAQCVEAAEAMGAEREHLASVVSSAVNVRSAGDIMTLTAAAATGIAHIEILQSAFVYFSLKFKLCCSSSWRCDIEGPDVEGCVEHCCCDPCGKRDRSFEQCQWWE